MLPALFPESCQGLCADVVAWRIQLIQQTSRPVSIYTWRPPANSTDWLSARSRIVLCGLHTMLLEQENL